MKKYLLLLAVGVLVASVIVLALLALGWSDEPSHKGKRLTEWLEDYYHTPSGQTNYAAAAAVQAMGADCVLYLLNLLTNRPSELTRQCYWMANTLVVEKLRWRKKYFGKPVLHSEYAEYGFRCLGRSASNAIPSLLPLLSDPDIGGWAAIALTDIGLPAVPAMIRVLTNGIMLERHRLASHMWRLRGDAHLALPALLACQTNVDSDLRFYATACLAQLQIQPSLIVPALTDRLNDSNQYTRYRALEGLGRFGLLASNSAPAVTLLLSDTNLAVRMEATNGLRAIDPRSVPSL